VKDAGEVALRAKAHISGRFDDRQVGAGQELRCEILRMMDWVFIVFVAFKVLVFGTGMFFAIKWHYGRENKEKQSAVLRAGGKMAAVFVLSLLGLLFLTFGLGRMLGLDLTFP
jgi:hypothetical protein